MVAALVHKIAFSGIAAAIAAGASLVSSASVEPQSAYGATATRVEAEAAARQAARIFDRGDMNNDSALDEDEFVILAVVTAELAHLNGFVPVDADAGIETVALPRAGGSHLGDDEKARIKARAKLEYRLIAGDDERLVADEFISAQLEQFLANDLDRNGVLAGAELSSFALAQSKLSAVSS